MKFNANDYANMQNLRNNLMSIEEIAEKYNCSAVTVKCGTRRPKHVVTASRLRNDIVNEYYCDEPLQVFHKGIYRGVYIPVHQQALYKAEVIRELAEAMPDISERLHVFAEELVENAKSN